MDGKQQCIMIHEPKRTLEATQWVVKILDAKYEKADLNGAVTENRKHLRIHDKEKMPKLPTEFEDLFDGTLGDCDTEPVFLKLQEGAKQYHNRSFSTPKAHKGTLKKGAKAM